MVGWDGWIRLRAAWGHDGKNSQEAARQKTIFAKHFE